MKSCDFILIQFSVPSKNNLFSYFFFLHVLCATLHTLVTDVSENRIMKIYSKGDLGCTRNLMLLPDFNTSFYSKGNILSQHRCRQTTKEISDTTSVCPSIPLVLKTSASSFFQLQRFVLLFTSSGAPSVQLETSFCFVYQDMLRN